MRRLGLSCDCSENAAKGLAVGEYVPPNWQVELTAPVNAHVYEYPAKAAV